MARAKTAKKTKPKVSDYFTPTELNYKYKSFDPSMAGKFFVIRPSFFKEEFRQRKFMVWQCYGGNGTDAAKISSSLQMACLHDADFSKMYASDLVAEFIGDLTEFGDPATLKARVNAKG